MPDANGTNQEEKVPLMERLGVQYMRRLSEKWENPEPEDEIHILNPRERKELRNIERWAVFRAAMAGALSAGISALASVVFWDRLGDDPLNPSWGEIWAFWSVVGAITLVATIIEILFLYVDALRSVHKLARAAGLDMFPQGDDDAAVARVMVRAALEMPNPPTVHYGVDPRREVSKLRLFLSTAVYKAKVTATNFILKALGRKVLGRAGARAYMEFISVPVFAFWDGLICWWTVREARIRAMGPSAAEELSHILTRDLGDVSPFFRTMLFRAIGTCIVTSVDLHPNLVALFNSMYNRLGDPEDEDLDVSDRFLNGLEKLTKEEQIRALQVLEIASIIDGKLAARERKTIKEAREICGFEDDLARVKRLRKTFTSGNPMPAEVVLSKL